MLAHLGDTLVVAYDRPLCILVVTYERLSYILIVAYVT